MDKQNDIKTELFDYYKKWLEEIIEQGYFYNDNNYSCAFDSNNNENEFSHPYFCDIPDNWTSTDIRLMICGEEGNGEVGKNTNLKDNEFIKKMQKHNSGYINGNREWNFNLDNGAFAKRFRQIADKNNYINKSISVIWNECDKICRIQRKRNNGALLNTESHILHGRTKPKNNKGLSTDILYEEIRILKPTHIVFLGWHYASLGIDYKKYKSKFPSYNKNKNTIKDNIADNYTSPMLITEMHLPETKDKIKIYYINHPSSYNYLTNNAKINYDKDIKKIINKINE